MGHKYETTVSQIWDQLRHVEGSLAQRLTMAETSHVATLQEVDEAKEATSEVLQRVDDIKRHTSALENKLESFNTQVGVYGWGMAPLRPLRSRAAQGGCRPGRAAARASRHLHDVLLYQGTDRR